MEFTHFDEQGNAWMVDVGEKADTMREATAKGSIWMSRECLDRILEGTMKKGDVLGVARIAGIMGAKRTADLIPLCHHLNLTKLSVEFTVLEGTLECSGQEDGSKNCGIQAVCIARTFGKTGVEMEALTGVSTALLTIYDMCKAVDRSMQIGNIYLEHKSGGKSGEFFHGR